MVRQVAAPVPGMGWKDVAWLMLSDVVGTSVLTFAGVAHSLGWFLAVTFIMGLFPVSLYVSVLMARTRELVLSEARLQREEEPAVGTMGEVALRVFGSRRACVAVYTVVYGYTLLGQASYLLVMATSAQGLTQPAGLCITVAAAASCAVLVIPVVMVRRLGESVGLCRFNSLLLILVLSLAIWAIVSSGRGCSKTSPDAFAADISLLHVMGPATNVLYAYAGQWMYFELMDTMTAPGDFPKAFLMTGPFMVGLYLTVALVGTLSGISEGDIVMGMPRGPLKQAACLGLFVHVLIVYLIKSIVLTRHFHGLHSPGDLDSNSRASYAKHSGWGIGMLLFGFLVANAIPFFAELMGLIGGLFAGPINFIFPIGMYLVALDRHAGSSRRRSDELDRLERSVTSGSADCAVSETGSTSGTSASPCTPSTQATQSSTEAHGASPRSQAACDAEASLATRAARGLRHVRGAEAVLMVAITAFVLATMVFGVSDVVRTIFEKTSTYGAPFSCHALQESKASGCHRRP